MTARRELADIQKSHPDQVYLTLCFDITPWTLRLWKFCFLGLSGLFLVVVFLGAFFFFLGGGGLEGFFVLWLWRFFVFQNAVPAINLIFKVSHKEHVHIYQDGIYTIQLSSRNQIENTQKYNKHCKHHFQGICLFLVYKQRHPIFLFMSYKSSWI